MIYQVYLNQVQPFNAQVDFKEEPSTVKISQGHCFVFAFVYLCFNSVGKSANTALVLAQLRTGDEDCGLQAFLVPIRDPNTHQPLPGQYEFLLDQYERV